MVHYHCECLKCGDKLVSKATWYRHNKQRVRRNATHLYLAGASAETGNGHTLGAPSSPPGSFYVKEPSPEDMDLEATNIKQAARSDPVGVICLSNLCPLGSLTFCIE